MIDEELRQAINNSDESLRSLASRAGVEASSVVRFVRGERDLRLQIAARIAEALNLHLKPKRLLKS